MIPYGHQSINQNDINEIIKVLKSDWLTQGPKILEFEKSLATYCGSKYAIVCGNGTQALHLAYLACGLKIGDEVITTPNTFVATSNMILVTGAKPIFCDIRLDTYNINEDKIEELITDKSKAISVVHFAGQPCEMRKIKEIADRHKLIIIEDACHALGSEYKTNKIGGCTNSDITVFSFHPVKSITTGEGGAILTNNKDYYEKLLSLRSHGIHKDENGKNIMTELGYNYRMNDIQATLGISQLKRLDNFIKKRHKIIKWYKQELKDIDDIILPIETPESYSAWHIYIIRTKDSNKRNSLSNYLKDNKIGVNFHYPAVYSHPYYREIGYNIKLENMELYHNSCITLPCHVLLTKQDIKYIANTIKNFINKSEIKKYE